MRIIKIAPRVTLNPKPYMMRFLFGLPLSIKRKTKLDLQVDKKTQILDISRAQKFGFT